MNRRLYWLAVLFLAATAAALAVDIPIATYCRQAGVPGFIRELLSLAEVFGHGLGAGCILLTAFMIDTGSQATAITHEIRAALALPSAGTATLVGDPVVGATPCTADLAVTKTVDFPTRVVGQNAVFT